MTAPAAKKPVTSPAPARAHLDTRPTLLDLRVLLKVCAHDRMSIAKGGQGCLIASKKIALALGVHHTSVSTSLSRLTEYGYIIQTKRSEDGRGRTYRVIYTEADDLAVRNAEPKSSLPLGETISEKSFLQNHKVVSRDFENADNFQIDANHQYKEGKHPKELGKNSDKSARFQRGVNFESKASTAECLRHVEQGIKDGSIGLSSEELLSVAEWLYEVYDFYFDEDERLAFWAQRLSGDIHYLIPENETQAAM